MRDRGRRASTGLEEPLSILTIVRGFVAPIAI
jgi:hypothetical protein